MSFDDSVRGPINIAWDRHRHLVYRQGDANYRPLAEIAHDMDMAA